jgi:hypothetical protein
MALKKTKGARATASMLCAQEYKGSRRQEDVDSYVIWICRHGKELMMITRHLIDP